MINRKVVELLKSSSSDLENTNEPESIVALSSQLLGTIDHYLNQLDDPIRAVEVSDMFSDYDGRNRILDDIDIANELYHKLREKYQIKLVAQEVGFKDRPSELTLQNQSINKPGKRQRILVRDLTTHDVTHDHKHQTHVESLASKVADRSTSYGRM